MKPCLAVSVLISSLAWGQDAPALKARELFYNPPQDSSVQKPPDQTQTQAAPPKTATKRTTATAKKTTASSTPPATAHTVEANIPLGLRYSLLKLNTGGKYDPVDAETVFRSGDRVRLQVDSNTTGY